MRRKIIVTIFIATALSLAACGKKEKESVIISVGDTNNDSGLNEVVGVTNDTNDNKTNTTEQKEETVKTDSATDYITSGFVADNGDVYVFNVDNTYESYIVETGVSTRGTYDTDGKTYITLKCMEDTSTDTDEEYEEPVEEMENVEFIIEAPEGNQVEVAYTIEEPTEDGKTHITEFDKEDNIVREYIINRKYITAEEIKKEKETKKETVLSEITYQITRTTTTDEYENSVEVLVLSKGDTNIILQKQFELE